MSGDPVWKQGKRPPKPKRRLPARSVRRLSETEARAHVREQVIERDHYRCVGPDRGLPGLCASLDFDRPPLEVHEVTARGTHPGSHLNADVCVTLCQFHHDAVTSPVGAARDLAVACGLLVRNSTPVMPHVRDAS